MWLTFIDVDALHLAQLRDFLYNVNNEPLFFLARNLDVRNQMGQKQAVSCWTVSFSALIFELLL